MRIKKFERVNRYKATFTLQYILRNSVKYLRLVEHYLNIFRISQNYFYLLIFSRKSSFKKTLQKIFRQKGIFYKLL